MDLWLRAEVRTRRHDALRFAHRRRLARLAESGRSTSIRVRVADTADILSDALAALARSLRAKERLGD
jgi:hypothetical protein